MQPSKLVDSKKNQKRKKEFPKLTAEEINKKILYLFVENLIPFEKIENAQFRSFLKNFNGLNNAVPGSSLNIIQLPNYETLIDYSNMLYHDYQDYFKNYFSKQKDLKISLTCHNWKPSTEINSYMFLNAHYINKRFHYCELPLGLFEFDKHTLSTFLVRDTMLKDLKDKLFSITTNYVFDNRILDLFKFVSNEDKIENKIIYCLPTRICSIIKEFFTNLQENISTNDAVKLGEGSKIAEPEPFNDVKMEIPCTVQLFLGKIYDKFRSISFDMLEPLASDTNQEYFGVLTDYMLKNERSFCLLYLTSVLFYKESILEIIQKDPSINIKDEDWKLLKFTVEFVKRFYDVVISCSDTSNPTIHMTLKWIKVLVIHVTTFNRNLKQYSEISPNLSALVSNVSSQLTVYHNDIDGKFDLILASYLHPSTKRYLKENQIGEINKYVGGKSAGPQSNIDAVETGFYKEMDVQCLDNLDDLIMEIFDCSGKATKECYEYESSATNEIKYSKNNKYITKESGPHILQFWEKNHERYSTLADLARQTLSIQLTTDRCFETFKNLFPELQKSTQYLKNSPGDIQVLFFLHKLVTTYDISNFDPKNFDLDIDDYRIEQDESDIEDDIDMEYEMITHSTDINEGSADVSVHKRQKK